MSRYDNIRKAAEFVGIQLTQAQQFLRVYEKQIEFHVHTCAECAEMNLDSYMIVDSVWRQVAQSDEVLHLECLEKRLGREITREDLIDCPGNKLLLRIVRPAAAQE